MKEIIKKIILWIITVEAKLILLRYRPKIIAITGSVGKTTTKDVVFSALSECVHIRKNKKSLNSDIGVPLTILGCDSGWNSMVAWTKIILLGAVRVIYKKKYPKWLVLEVGIDRPGDMKKVAKWLKPDVAVFTAFSEVPVHVEFFESPEHVMAEKSILLDYVKSDGTVFLNADDANVSRIKHRSKVKVVTYSKNEASDYFSTNYDINYENGVAAGISFKINYGGNVVPVSLDGIVGEQYIYPALAAISIAHSLGFSVIEANAGLKKFKPAPGRMRLIPGIKNSLIIDDTYNASPIAVKSAIETLTKLKSVGPKIVAIGDMLELGRFSASEHRKVGELIASKKINYLVTVGLRAEAIADQAMACGMPEHRVIKLTKSTKARDVISSMLVEGSTVLVKGSQSIRMERVVEGIMKESNKKGELLVRQEREWLNR